MPVLYSDLREGIAELPNVSEDAELNCQAHVTRLLHRDNKAESY